MFLQILRPFTVPSLFGESNVPTRDLQVHEQTNGPSELQLALRNQAMHVKFRSLWTKMERLTPTFRRNVAKNDRIMRDVLIPQIKLRLGMSSEAKDSKTVVDLALKDSMQASGKIKEGLTETDLIEIVYSQIKIFISAGHETTAQSL